ncbi:MAG: hypothetical protein WA908_11090 [Pontixanthobacter sp.]
MAVKTSGWVWRIAIWVLIALVGLVVIAWIDGGEEPLRTIVQPADLPGNPAAGAPE